MALTLYNIGAVGYQILTVGHRADKIFVDVDGRYALVLILHIGEVGDNTFEVGCTLDATEHLEIIYGLCAILQSPLQQH